MLNGGFIPLLARNAALSALLVLLVLGAAAAYLKLEFLGTTLSSDYDTYVLTAQYLKGEVVAIPGDISIPQRLLKPAYPAYLAVASGVTDFHAAALAQALFFYLLFIVAMYLLARAFFEDTFPSVIVVLLSAFSYPVLKYGLDTYSETGAWFMYALSLWLALRFRRHPTAKLFLFNAILVTVGFLWKEYAILTAIMFGLVILSHSALKMREKFLYVLAYAGIFLSIHVPWQAYVLQVFDFSYLDWYLKGGADGFSYEFTLKNIIKSTAALLGVMWLFVPLGFSRLRDSAREMRLFSYLSASVPLLGYAWGFISSRLLYVIAPPMLLVAVSGMRDWSRRTQVAIVAAALVANIGWLVLSYRITL